MSYEVHGAPASDAALERCLGDVEVFLRDHWGQRPLLRRGDGRSLADLLSLDDVDRLLTRTSPRTPAFRLVRGGEAIPRSRYTRRGTMGGQRLDDLPDPGRVLALFHDGATIALQGMHRWWPPVAELCRGLQDRLTHPVQANAYITPPGSRGLDVHHDTHDVIALQTEGRKHWVVHEPAVPLALPRQRWSSSDHQPGERVIDTELLPGDALYLPRGTPHAAETTDTYSVHLTLGLRAVTWQQLLERAIARAADDVRFRASLPVGFADDPGAVADDAAAVLKQAGEWLATVDPVALTTELAEELWKSRLPDLRHALTQQTSAGTLDDDTVVRPRPDLRVVLRTEGRSHEGSGEEPDGDRLAIVSGDRTVVLPAALRPTVERLLSEPTRVGDLADVLDPEGRLVLVRRLVREGLLLAGAHPDA